jgi:site-specific DNA-cytosine methylase
MRILFKVKNWRISQIYFTTNIISHSKEKRPMSFLGKKKKFKEGQAEQVLDDLFFEAIKGVERLKPKVVIFENVMGLLFKKNKTYVDTLIELYQYLSNQGHHSQPVYTPLTTHQRQQKN